MSGTALKQANSFSPQSNPMRYSSITPILQMEELRLKKQLSQGHTAEKQWG